MQKNPLRHPINTQPKVIGNGMMARAFSGGVHLNPDAVIFASGVSNSDCTDATQFERERTMLIACLAETPPKHPFLYFGTCSVYDPDAQTKAYVIHKQMMEALALSHPVGYVIRLPQVAGPNAPYNTLIAALVSKIRNGEEVRVWAHAVRNIIDVEDAVKIIDAWLAQGQPDTRILNVANPITVPVMDVIHAIESALHLVAKITLVPKGARYEIDTESMRGAANSAGVEFGPDYLSKVIRKYYT